MMQETAKNPSREALQIIQRMAKKAIFKPKAKEPEPADDDDDDEEKETDAS